MGHRANKARREEKQQPKLLTLTYKCPKTNKEVSLDAEQLSEYLSISVSPCDICGEHKTVTFYPPKCVHCGEHHRLVIMDE